MRISTAETWNSALLNLQNAQARQEDANNQVSTQKVATDLMGYGRSSEIIAAYQTTLSRTNSYIEVNKTVTERLDSQNIALTTASQAASDAKDTLMNAPGLGQRFGDDGRHPGQFRHRARRAELRTQRPVPVRRRQRQHGAGDGEDLVRPELGAVGGVDLRQRYGQEDVAHRRQHLDPDRHAGLGPGPGR
ncbi:MAG: hypothetical protein WDN06_08450 [Asticcacaulis sp.]